MESSGGRPRRADRIAVALLAAALLAQGAWNAWAVPPLSGYDAAGHAGYALTILEEGRVPQPQEGWSTFHPPLWYGLAAGVWAVLEPLGPRAVQAGLRGIGVLGWLAAALVALRLVRGTGASRQTALVAAALTAWVPCAQMSAAMVGNEALAFGLGALALPPLLRLQRDPGDVASAALAAVCVGLACATKYTGLFLLPGCALPFLRPGLDRRSVRALATALAIGIAVAGPVYLRNLALTGSPVPMTREVEAVRIAEASDVARPRRVGDYLWLDPRVLLRPSIHHVAGPPPPPPRRNETLTNVWGALYASIWYDAFGHRIPIAFHRDGIVSGPLLAALGLVPTALLLCGFGLALAEAVRRRGRSPDAPLVAIAVGGVAAFVLFTWQAPMYSAVKGSYLLPLAVPAAVFFARGLARLPEAARRGALVCSALAAIAAALVFTEGLVFPAKDPLPVLARWRVVDRALPAAHIGDAVDRLGPAGQAYREAGDL